MLFQYPRANCTWEAPPGGQPPGTLSVRLRNFYCGCSCCTRAGVCSGGTIILFCGAITFPSSAEPAPSSTEPLPSVPQSLPSTAAEPVPSSAEPLPSSAQAFPPSPDPWSSSTNYTTAQTNGIPPPTATGPYGGSNTNAFPPAKPFPQVNRVAFTTSCG